MAGGAFSFTPCFSWHGNRAFEGLVMARPVPADLAGLADYEIVSELGTAGMVRTYLVQNRIMGRYEVLKVLGRQITQQPEVLQRFMTEIGAVARLQHPNIVTAYSAFRWGDSVIFPMEYLEGHDLARLVQARGHLPISQACYFVHQAARALQYAHEQGLVHRDFRPGHLMVCRSSDRPVVKVLDFGIAKAVVESLALEGWRGNSRFEVRRNSAQAVEDADAVTGTAAFIAPEQIANPQRADIRADIYSLGCSLYYLLTARPPFQGVDLSEVLQAHHSMDARLLNLVRPQVPVELAALVARMMAKDPERRVLTPVAVAAALTPFFNRSGARVRPADSQVSSNDLPTNRTAPAPPSQSGSGELVVPKASPSESPNPASEPLGRAPTNCRRARISTRLPQAALAGVALAGTLLAVVLALVPRDRPPAVMNITPVSESGEVIKNRPRPLAVTIKPPPITSAPPDLPVNPFASEFLPAPERAIVTIIPPTPPPSTSPLALDHTESFPAWEWRDQHYILTAEKDVFAAAQECGRYWRQYKRADSELQSLNQAEGKSSEIVVLVKRLVGIKQAYLQTLQVLRENVDRVGKLYEEYSDDPGVRKEVEAKNKAAAHRLYLKGPSAKFRGIVRNLEIHEKWDSQPEEPIAPRSKGKRGRAAARKLPPNF
jgi:serine/threonine protein kinase